MRVRQNVHFEILGQRGGGWTVLGIQHAEKEAIKEAQMQRCAGGYRAVKVIREKYDEESRTFNNREVFYEGKRDQPSKFEGDQNAVACWRPQDFYSFEGRRTISRLLRRELDNWGITATELVHCPEYVERLEDSGTTIQRAVQQVAIAEAEAADHDVQARMKQLYELIKLASEQLRADWKKNNIPTLEADGFADLVAKLEGASAQSYLLNCAMVGYLKDAESLREKMPTVLSFLSDDDPPWVTEVIDSFVGELLSGATLIQELIGDQQSLKGALISIANLSQGDYRPVDGTAASDAARLSEMIKAGRLPKSQRALVQRLTQEIASTRPLSDGALLDEAKAVSALSTHLVGDDVSATQGDGSSLIGGVQMVEALELRSGRLLMSETIGEYLQGSVDQSEKIQRLLDLEPHTVGAANKRKVANFLLPILDSAEAAAFFIEQNGTVPERLKRLNRLQQHAITSDFQESNKDKIIVKLDEYCVAVLKSNNFFKRVAQQNGDRISIGINLLKMCAAGYFTEGNASRAARAQTKRVLQTHGFLDEYLTASDCPDGPAERLRNFQDLLAAAGLAKDGAAPGAQ